MDANKNQHDSYEGQKDRHLDPQPNKKSAEGDQSHLKSQNAEQLQDKDHRMNERTNDVQGSVSYDENTRKDTTDSDPDAESRWKDIKSDYRKRYPSITDEDVSYRTGEFDSMTDKIAKRTNRNYEDVNNEIRNWDSSADNS